MHGWLWLITCVKRQLMDRLEKGEYDSYGMLPLPAVAESSSPGPLARWSCPGPSPAPRLEPIALPSPPCLGRPEAVSLAEGEPSVCWRATWLMQKQ